MKKRHFLTGLLTAVLLLAVASFSADAVEIPKEEPAGESAPAEAVTLTFHLPESGEDPIRYDCTPGGWITVPGERTVQDGKVLAGWRRDAVAGSVEYRPGEKLAVSESGDWYPVWREPETRTVTFLTDSGRMTRTAREGGTVTNVPEASAKAGLCFVGWMDESGWMTLPSQRTIWEDTVYTAAYAPELNREHVVYIHGYDTGRFEPESSMTRAEAASMLFRMLPEAEAGEPILTDVPESAWYGSAAERMAQLGAILPAADGSFRPEQWITRAEFLYALARFFPLTEEPAAFSDVPVDYWAAPAVNAAAARGWTSGYADGTFRPEAPITRAEAVSMLNRVLGRRGDGEVGSYHIVRFWDLPASHWAFAAVMEAATEHTAEWTDAGEHWTEYPEVQLAPGYHLLDGELMYVDPETGWYVFDTTVDGFRFDADGRYTSGSRELDGYVKTVLDRITNEGMSREQMLHAAYNYTRDSFTYLRRNYYEIGDTGWEQENALVMFQTGYGNCYCYTSVFYYLSRQLGYESTAISGVVGSTRAPHGWVEIDINGVTYIFDTELEMAYRKKGVTIYDFYMMPYSRTPWAYVK